MERVLDVRVGKKQILEGVIYAYIDTSSGEPVLKFRFVSCGAAGRLINGFSANNLREVKNTVRNMVAEVTFV